MELGKDKLKCVVNYGTAPFFAERLKKQASESESLAVCCKLTKENKLQVSWFKFIQKKIKLLMDGPNVNWKVL